MNMNLHTIVNLSNNSELCNNAYNEGLKFYYPYFNDLDQVNHILLDDIKNNKKTMYYLPHFKKISKHIKSLIYDNKILTLENIESNIKKEDLSFFISFHIGILENSDIDSTNKKIPLERKKYSLDDSLEDSSDILTYYLIYNNDSSSCCFHDKCCNCCSPECHKCCNCHNSICHNSICHKCCNCHNLECHSCHNLECHSCHNSDCHNLECHSCHNSDCHNVCEIFCISLCHIFTESCNNDD